MPRIALTAPDKAVEHFHINEPSLDYESNTTTTLSPALDAAVEVDLSYGVTSITLDGDHDLTFTSKPEAGFVALRELRANFTVGESLVWPSYVKNSNDFEFADLSVNGLYTFLLSCQNDRAYIIERTFADPAP